MLGPMDFDYVHRAPAARLSRFVESVWYARGQIPYARERIAPTGSTVAVIVLGAPIREIPDNGRGVPFLASHGFLIGPHDRPVINEPTGETYCVGIVTTPVGCHPVFGLRPASMRGRAGDLTQLWAPATELRQRLLATPSALPSPWPSNGPFAGPASAPEPEPGSGSGSGSMAGSGMGAAAGPAAADRAGAMLDLVEAALVPGVEHTVAFDRCERAVAVLTADPRRGISDLASELGISHGHLDREFSTWTGLTPRALSRILRLRALLTGLDVFAPVNWTELAARWGWYDQSHFIRDFKRYTGVTPSGYQRAQVAAFTEPAPGFIPQ
jgi:AraC-like DNA-binding protein